MWKPEGSPCPAFRYAAFIKTTSASCKWRGRRVRPDSDNRICVEADRPALALVGHLNFIHHNQVQVLGVAEVAYLEKLEQAEHAARLSELFDFPMALVIVANNLPVPQSLRDYCHTHDVPLLTSALESPYLMDVLRIYLQRMLAVSTIKHGVFLDVLKWACCSRAHRAWAKANWPWS